MSQITNSTVSSIQVFLMVVIMLTGNYNFFNFLFMGLCLSLADDSWLRSGQKGELFKT